MSSLTFIKHKEDFTCEKCGSTVQGNGYTNHCPECLWSKHVDIHPGDRRETCGGLMEPIRVEVKHKEYAIIHKCVICGVERPNKAVKADNFQMLVQISAENAKRFMM